MSSLKTATARLTFIGAGNMASSIIGGLVSNGYPTHLIHATDLDTSKLEDLKSRFGIETSNDNEIATKQADAIILAVKPQIMSKVVSPLSSCLQKTRPLIVSIAAGITVSNLQDWIGQDLPIVRTMPNTPALVKTGATGLFANFHVSETQKDIAFTVFDAIGTAIWFDEEEDIDRVVAVSGSGPAYFFLVMEAMEKAAVKLGLTPEVARQLTLQTALGSAKLALSSDIDTAQLRQNVTSPGGTTEQAIMRLEDGGLISLFEEAMQAAMDRSKELAG